MESIKNFFKNHKILVIVLAIILVLAIVFSILIYKMFFGYGNDKYKDRLDPIEGLEISNYTKDKLKEEISSLDKVNKVYDVTVEGRIIKVTFVVDKELEKDTAKEYGDKVLEYFSDDEKDAYDIQIIITSNEEEDEEEKRYPIMGYRKASLGVEEYVSRGITWSNN